MSGVPEIRDPLAEHFVMWHEMGGPDQPPSEWRCACGLKFGFSDSAIDHVAEQVELALRATTDVIWAVQFDGDPIDEWYWQRSDAEEYLRSIREQIKAGVYEADDYEPMVLVQGTRTEFRPIEGPWSPAGSRPS